MLTVERQEAQLTLLGCLLLLVVVGGGAFFYIRRRRHRLIEAEERIETLNRLLADATKGDDEQRVAGSTDKEVEDGQFFRKILLQQLGIIRLVATQPTSQKSGVASSYIRYHEPRVAGRKPFSVGGSVSRNRPYI